MIIFIIVQTVPYPFPFVSRVQTKISMQTTADGRTILLGETPKTIRLRQFTEISEAQGYESEVEFAQAVVNCNTTERLRMLMKYYERKDYPNESVESYSQIIQSSQEMNTSKSSKEDTNFVKKKSSRNPAKPSRKPSRQKSFKNVFKPHVVKPNKIDRLPKPPSKYLKTKTKLNPSDKSTVIKTSVKEKHKTDRLQSFINSRLKDDSTLSFRKNEDGSYGDTADILHMKNDRVTSVGSDEVDHDEVKNKSTNVSLKLTSVIAVTDYDETLSRGNSLVAEGKSLVTEATSSGTNTKNLCDDILNDILTACSHTNIDSTQDSSSNKPHPTSNVFPLSGKHQDSQNSSFLDELLFDRSQKTSNRTQDISYESPSREVGCVEEPKHCKNEQASIIDDLI